MIWALVLRHWRALSIVAAAAVAAIALASWRASVYRAGAAAGRAQCEAAHTAALDAARAEIERLNHKYRRTLPGRERALVEIATPLPPPDPRVLVREVIREIPGPCRCDSIGSDFRVHFNAASDRAREIAAGAVSGAAPDADWR